MPSAGQPVGDELERPTEPPVQSIDDDGRIARTTAPMVVSTPSAPPNVATTKQATEDTKIRPRA